MAKHIHKRALSTLHADIATTTTTRRQCSESANLRQVVKPQPKVIRNSNQQFHINPYVDVCRIASEMLWIHCLAISVIFPSFVKKYAGGWLEIF